MDVDANAERAQAATLTRTLGYGRRHEELADAETALGTNRPRERLHFAATSAKGDSALKNRTNPFERSHD
jgi:hypothetical protein